MRRQTITRVLLAVLLTSAMLSAAEAPGQVQTRELTGIVLAKSNDAPLANAIVYLKNTKTRDMRTYITAGDGRYRFPALQMNADYEVYAERDGHRSETKTLSFFDSRRQASITLHINLSQ